MPAVRLWRSSAVMLPLRPSSSSEELDISDASESANRFICSSVFSRYRSMLAQLGTARHGRTRHGLAGSGTARLGSALPDQNSTARLSTARLGSARLGSAPPPGPGGERGRGQREAEGGAQRWGRREKGGTRGAAVTLGGGQGGPELLPPAEGDGGRRRTKGRKMLLGSPGRSHNMPGPASAVTPCSAFAKRLSNS